MCGFLPLRKTTPHAPKTGEYGERDVRGWVYSDLTHDKDPHQAHVGRAEALFAVNKKPPIVNGSGQKRSELALEAAVNVAGREKGLLRRLH